MNSSQIPSSFIRGGNSEPATTVPKAYINYILLDDQFKFAGGGASRVGTCGLVKDHWTDGLQNINVIKSGYLFVYVSNESNFNVFFDNLEVVHTRGAILEETHYYPFGLTMAGISSKALAFGGAENKMKWNKGSELQNREFSDGIGLELYATPLRSLDPQLGRWWQIDSKPDYSQSLYSSMGNNPILKNDPLGDTTKIGDSRKQTLTTANGKTYSGSALTKKLIKEWEMIGGVKLGLNKKTGEIKFKGNNDKVKFSRTGREEIMKMITGNGQITIDFTTRIPSQADGNNIFLNPSQIDGMVNGASSDLNSLTLSYGMATLHEDNHTNIGGGHRHGLLRFGMIDQPDIIGNKIRNEMSDATGTNWGQRESYNGMLINQSIYIPFSFQSQTQIQSAKQYEGTWRGTLMFPPPTTSVIIIPNEL